MDENFQKLYGALVNAKLLDVSFDAFSQYMESDGYQQKVFQAVTDKGLFNQSFDQFKSAYAPTPVEVEKPDTMIGGEQSQEKNTWLEDGFGKNVVTDFFGDVYRAGQSGWAAGALDIDAIQFEISARIWC
mgnify:CR=1 FL=1